MSIVRIATVSLLLAASSIFSITVNSKSPPPPSLTWPGMPPFPTWPGMPPFPSWGNMPPLPPYGGMPPYPPGVWPPGQGGGEGCSCSCSCNTVTEPPRSPKVFVVGGNNGWTFGYNYTDWALKNGPFYQGDTLVFQYSPDDHSVLLLKDYQSFKNCNLAKSQNIGADYTGDSEGFQFELDKGVYYFACGKKKGIHCNVGLMKFIVEPSNS